MQTLLPGNFLSLILLIIFYQEGVSSPLETQIDSRANAYLGTRSDSQGYKKAHSELRTCGID